MAKLTLSVDAEIISRARRYAARHKVSISGLVGNYLSAVTEQPPSEKKLPPVLSSVRGILRSANTEHYKRYLAKKYR
jgi:hypothetical protein